MGICAENVFKNSTEVNHGQLLFFREFSLVFNFIVIFSELHMYKAVLVVPDIYDRGRLRELMNLLLLRMGFGSCFLVQVCISTPIY